MINFSDRILAYKRENGYMAKPFNEQAIFKTLNTITARMSK